VPGTIAPRRLTIPPESARLRLNTRKVQTLLNDADKPALQRLGDLLRYRRIELDPAWRDRKTFTGRHNLTYRVINDLENGRRANFEPGTVASIEVAYKLAPGSLQRTAAGGDLEPAVPPRRPAQFQIIRDPDGDLAAQRRVLADQWAAMVTAPVGRELGEVKDAIDAAGPGAAGADIFPGLPALAEIWDMVATPGQYKIFYMAVWLYLQRNPGMAKAG
jgi:hypothetical protein